MPYRYKDEEETPLLDGEVGYEEPKEEKTEPNEEDSEEYYELPTSLKARTRVWSVISLALGILSVLLCPFYFVSLVFAIGAVITAAVSRNLLGYFDNLSLIGLVAGIIGVVFGIFSLAIDVSGVLSALN